jgi:hypothetical protein
VPALAAGRVRWHVALAAQAITAMADRGASRYSLVASSGPVRARDEPPAPGAFTNVPFVDAKRLLEALRFDELRVKGSHHVYGRPGVAEQLNLQDRGGQASRTSCGSSSRSSAGTIFESRMTNERSRLPNQRFLER